MSGVIRSSRGLISKAVAYIDDLIYLFNMKIVHEEKTD